MYNRFVFRILFVAVACFFAFFAALQAFSVAENASCLGMIEPFAGDGGGAGFAGFASADSAFADSSFSDDGRGFGACFWEDGAGDFIRWVDLNFTEAVLDKAYLLDVKFHAAGKRFGFVDALSYLAVKNGNQFSHADLARLDLLAAKVEGGGAIGDEMRDNKYFKYYKKAFGAVFSEFVGSFRLPSGEAGYGLTAYFPFARGYWFSHYDDFGSKRTYGFKRKHLGHDMMGGIGTPIIAIEGGTVTELGWNKYGGWRVGILSFDKTRYYYYAHLRRNHPYPKDLKLGDEVCAGEVVGYLGMTGYSTTENQNLKSGQPHLHLGLQLIFDESQIKGNKEIWVDLYAITSFLQKNRAKTTKNPETKDYKSTDLKAKLKPETRLRELGF